ncbi:hypothetical protein LX16_1545 [Stackebrandtia albiflava]|uniref:YdhG-like domain-containing protein n=1 Tax=Stackebrandtia albiflava TaxID=406432 RepID=A0A562VD80_9ACTN|nr:DUF1801 domain-containing protein [Stackebrandtia albiflava]TWJ15830.1 hypothetical protein LX16_1545 [Stackebrandtia albiflava]
MAQRNPNAAAAGFSEQERAAMKARAKELKAEAGGGRGAKKAAADEAAVLSEIAAMTPADAALASRVHEIVTTEAPELAPKTWYGQPAYARDGKVLCFFRGGDVDKERYATLGFTTEARLDDGGLWPTSFAVTDMSEATRTAIGELVRRAVG